MSYPFPVVYAIFINISYLRYFIKLRNFCFRKTIFDLNNLSIRNFLLKT